MSGNHTILLVQENKHKNSRVWYDYDSVTSCVEGICALFEAELKRLNRNVANMSYALEDLYNFLDSYGDAAALVFNQSTKAYEPKDKAWIKQKIYDQLSRQAAGRR